MSESQPPRGRSSEPRQVRRARKRGVCMSERGKPSVGVIGVAGLREKE